jgi:hypothetical protein
MPGIMKGSVKAAYPQKPDHDAAICAFKRRCFETGL